jgi:nucleotide-binding universal stress UspA family protein
VSKTLLFGDDGSSCADVAWLWINNHEWAQWDVQVLQADVTNDGPAVREPVRADLSVETVRSPGDPRFELHTRGAHCDLLVVGAKGRGMLKRIHLGSTAEWLMHGPSAPLVITRSGRPTRRVLLAHDGSAHACAAEEALLGMPWIAGTTVSVVVADEGHDPRAIADEVCGRVEAAGARAEAEVRTDLPLFFRPRDLILEQAQNWQADLIALGSRGRTPWQSVGEQGLHRAGSTANSVVQNAACNVLLAQPRLPE